MPLFSVHALSFGDEIDNAARCLTSIRKATEHGRQWVQDVSVGLNSPTDQLLSFVRAWADSFAQACSLPVNLYVSKNNLRKYPMMRRMFYWPGRELQSWVMWFDDDSWVPEKSYAQFFSEAARNCSQAYPTTVMFGETWEQQLRGNQEAFFKSRSWYTGKPWGGKRGSRWAKFCTGGFWMLRSSIIRKYNWPDPLISHNGGDSMLGILLNQQGYTWGVFGPPLVYINADSSGKSSTAKRRGIDELKEGRLVGQRYQPGQPDDFSHHNIDVELETFPKEKKVSYKPLSGF